MRNYHLFCGSLLLLLMLFVLAVIWILAWVHTRQLPDPYETACDLSGFVLGVGALVLTIWIGEECTR